jgi:di/tricarboxylate transporter
MTYEAAYVFAVVAVAAILMASNRVRFDIVALLVVLALMLGGVLSIGEALSGFGSPVVVVVACLLVVGEMLARTGVARAVGDIILKRGGGNETRLLILIMLSAVVLGSIMSSTAIVSIFIPIVLRIAAETNLNASRLLLPMSYAALISGMQTLIATAPNIIVHEELKGAGFDGFGFFSFTPVGIAMVVVGIAYILLFGRRLLSRDMHLPVPNRRSRSIEDLWNDYRLDKFYRQLGIAPDSALIGQSIAASRLESRFAVRILGIVRHTGSGEVRIAAPAPATRMQAGDNLLVIGRQSDIERLATEQSLTNRGKSPRERQRWLWEIGGAAVLIHPQSSLVGKSLRGAEFRSVYGVHVAGLRRKNKPVAEFKDVNLRAADSLFVVGPWSRIQQLQQQAHDFVVTELPSEHDEIVPSYRRMPVALLILATMVSLVLFDVLPLVAAVMMAALAAVFTRCLTMEDAYRAINWSSLVLVAGMLPLADALEQSGGTQLLVDGLKALAGDAGPYAMMSLVFFLTAGLGMVLSNSASAVLVAPIAIYTAGSIGVSPYPLAVAVLIAASAAFSTPVSTPVVTLVVDPGRYTFMDFVKVGVPLVVLTYLVTLLVVPMIFPFYP